MNSVGLSKGKILKEILCLLKMFRDFKMLFPAVTHLVEGISLEILLTLKSEKSLTCLVDTRRPTVSITEQQSVLFLKTLIRNKASKFGRLE
jgi:hypothetical protein